jgi:lipopolysaccharide export system permease protein
LASRKVKGGLGLHLGLGILIAFSYIMFMQIATVFAVSGSVPPYIAVWIPNFIFGCLAAYLYKRAMR